MRPACRGDSRKIFEIHLQALEGLDEEDAEWFEAFLRVRSRRRKVLVAELAGNVIGFAIAYRYRRVAYIDSIAIDPRYRGLGIGSKLLGELERALKLDKAELVALSVKDSNKRALDFYLRNGYTLKGVVLIIGGPLSALPDAGFDGFVLRRSKAGAVSSRRRIKPSTWWSTLTEPVDRLIYRRFLTDEEAILAYKGRRLRGVAEFALDDELYVDYMALSSYSALDALRALLAGLRGIGSEAGARSVVVPVDASKRLIVEQLLSYGLHTIGTEYLAVKELD